MSSRAKRSEKADLSRELRNLRKEFDGLQIRLHLTEDDVCKHETAANTWFENYRVTNQQRKDLSVLLDKAKKKLLSLKMSARRTRAFAGKTIGDVVAASAKKWASVEVSEVAGGFRALVLPGGCNAFGPTPERALSLALGQVAKSKKVPRGSSS